MKIALATIAIVWLAICLTIGFPRLYGTGCDGRLFGFTLAQEESDFPHCQAINKLPFVK